MTVNQGGKEAQRIKSFALLYVVEWSVVMMAALLGVVTSGAYPWNAVGIWLLGLAGLARWLRKGSSFLPSSPAHGPLAIFLVSAGLGLWAVPNGTVAFERLFLILTAASLYLVLLDSRARERRIFSLGFAFLVGLGSLFLFTQIDWASSGARVVFMTRFTGKLTEFFPQLNFPIPPWNVLRNVMASLSSLGLLFLCAVIWEAWLERRANPVDCRERWMANVQGILAVAGMVILAGVLTVTTSRTPWIIFLVLAGLVVIWRGAGRLLGQGRRGRLGFFGMVSAVGVLSAGLLVGWQAGLFDELPSSSGPYSIAGRQEIYTQSWQLASEKPFTGAGLSAFPALYSSYIRVIPFRTFLDEDTGNSAYLNLLVEQGWLGLFGFVLILAVSLWNGLRRMDEAASPYLVAGVLAIIFIALHGLSHATLIATRALPLLFAPVGLVLANRGALKSPQPISSPRPGFFANWRFVGPGLGVILAVLLTVLLTALLTAILPAVRAQALANLGAVVMDHRDLADFPRDEWVYRPEGTLPPSAKSMLTRALLYDENNMTANFRLGLAAMQPGDYSNAILYLERALAVAPDHRGVRKSLGYSLLWSGDIERASVYLANLPETPQELEAYVHWWEKNEHPDRAEWAREMLNKINLDQARIPVER